MIGLSIRIRLVHWIVERYLKEDAILRNVPLKSEYQMVYDLKLFFMKTLKFAPQA